MSARVMVPRASGATSASGFLTALWEGIDKYDLDSTFSRLYDSIANLAESKVQERYLHMADCVALQRKVRANTPVLEWAEPAGNAVAADAFRLLTSRMSDTQPAKSKLHALAPIANAGLTLARANELCVNVDSGLHIDAKRKATRSLHITSVLVEPVAEISKDP